MVGSNPSNISNQSRKLNIGSSKILKDGSGCEASSYENFEVRTVPQQSQCRWVETSGWARKGGAAGSSASKSGPTPAKGLQLIKNLRRSSDRTRSLLSFRPIRR